MNLSSPTLGCYRDGITQGTVSPQKGSCFQLLSLAHAMLVHTRLVFIDIFIIILKQIQQSKQRAKN